MAQLEELKKALADVPEEHRRKVIESLTHDAYVMAETMKILGKQ